MLELDASALLGAATTLARLHQIFSSLQGAQDEVLVQGSIDLILPSLQRFRSEAERLGARLAVMAADRTLLRLSSTPCELTVGRAVSAMTDIESRFADHLTGVKMFAMSEQQAIFLQAADQLVEAEGFSVAYPMAAFEIEEASKCVVLGRNTAAVFHSMRMLEIGIRAISRRLGIPDPTRASEKNWGIILATIKEKIDELWPRNTRLAGTEGAEFESLYATLDAVKNPWRNTTMHVRAGLIRRHAELRILGATPLCTSKPCMRRTKHYIFCVAPRIL